MEMQELFNISIFNGDIREKGNVGNYAYIKVLYNDILYMFIFEDNKIIDIKK